MISRGEQPKGRPLINSGKEKYMAKFVVYKDLAGQYRWRLVANNGEKVAASEAYVSKQNAIRSAQRVRILAGNAAIVENSAKVTLPGLLRK